MLKDALQTLSAPPTAGERKQAIADVNAKITMLESQLGIKARLMPILNAPRAAARLAELQAQLAASNLTAAPAATVEAEPPTNLDAGIPTASLKEFRAMDAETRLNFSQDHGALTHADFQALTSRAKMEHCRNGGQILAENRRHHCTAAASFNS